MSTTYVQLLFTLEPVQPTSEILMAELAQIGFESFVELEHGLEAYIPQTDFKEESLQEVTLLKNPEFSIEYTTNTIAPKNWNEVWESDFKPIVVDNRCAVRADFHEPITADYELIITPKMSFGTGHHQTTYMMLQHILDLELEGASVLDMGCGTGVLAILAVKKGARSADAIDIEPWCFENTQENVLLHDIPTYASCLNAKGTLLLSGFYAADIEDIKRVCASVQLEYTSHLERENWVAVKFSKQ